VSAPAQRVEQMRAARSKSRAEREAAAKKNNAGWCAGCKIVFKLNAPDGWRCVKCRAKLCRHIVSYNGHQYSITLDNCPCGAKGTRT
jgi:hypothetical protein